MEWNGGNVIFFWRLHIIFEIFFCKKQIIKKIHISTQNKKLSFKFSNLVSRTREVIRQMVRLWIGPNCGLTTIRKIRKNEPRYVSTVFHSRATDESKLFRCT